MKKTFVILGVLCALLCRAEIQVSDVEVFSGYPWQEIAVGYTITGSDGGGCRMVAKVTDNKKWLFVHECGYSFAA